VPNSTTARLSSAQIASAMRSAGWPENAIPMGVAIALAESGGNPSAVNNSNRNGSRDYGLFQINSVHKSLLKQGNWANPVDNARMALKVYRDAGNSWKPWATFNHGSYRKFYKANVGSANISGDGKDDGFWQGAGKGISDVSGAGANIVTSAFTLGYIGDQAFWKRFGIAALAILLIIIGVWIVFRQPIAEAGKGLINLTPQGRALTVAKGVLK